jgi:GNAT superfamily N-acetyltransferase
VRVLVRAAAAADLPAVAALACEAQALHEAALPALYQPPEAAAAAIAADLARVRETPGARLLVAEADGAVVGYAHVEEQRAPASPYARASAALHVVAMVVDPARRSRGVGRALLGAVRGEARARGLDRVTLDVYAFNERGARVLRARGVRPAARAAGGAGRGSARGDVLDARPAPSRL